MMSPSKQLRDKVLDIVSKNKDIDFDDIITRMKKEVGIRGDSLIKLVDEILKWWEESGKILRMVDRRTKMGMYRMNENAKIAKDIVSEAISELGVEVPTELHEAWTADSVKKNSDIGSDRGYGITLKPHKNPNKHKHMLMKRGAGGKVKVEFDFGKKPEDVFVGTPQEVADHINNVLGLTEEIEISESAKYKKVKDLNPEQTLWMVGKEYFIISYSPYAHETAVFRSDRNGRVKDMSGVWATKGNEEPEGIAKMLAKHAEDFEIKEQK